jgi:hypothetical protein
MLLRCRTADLGLLPDGELRAATTVPPQNRVLTVLFSGVFMAALDVAIVASALPLLRSAFAVDTACLADRHPLGTLIADEGAWASRGMEKRSRRSLTDRQP